MVYMRCFHNERKQILRHHRDCGTEGTFNYSFTAPVCLLDGYFYFLEVGDDSNYSLNRTEDDGTIKPVCYLNKTGGEWLPYLGTASGNGSTIAFGYSFYREILFLNTATGKAVSTSFEEPGFSEELARNLQGDILEMLFWMCSAYQANRWKDCFWTEAATAPWTRKEAGYSSSLTETTPNYSYTSYNRQNETVSRSYDYPAGPQE